MTETRNKEQRQTRSPSLGSHNDKNHRRLIKASDKPTNIERQTGKTKPKTLITDPDRDTSTYNPNRPSYFSMQTKNNPSKRDSRAFEKSQSVITNRSSNKHHSIYQESPHRNMKYTQRGTSKPNSKKFLFPGLYATV